MRLFQRNALSVRNIFGLDSIFGGDTSKTVRLNTNKGFLFCIFQKEGKWVSQVYVHNSLFAGNIYFTTMVLS